MNMNVEWIKKNAEHTGTCGDELFWWQAGGNLYIEGHGAVAECAFIGDTSICNVVIAPGCTGIGEVVFWGCNLESVELPESLKYIGESAFKECKLKALTIPDGVEEIGNWAFKDNPLERVELPASLKSIGYEAFSGCELKTLIIPDGVEEIDDNAFDGIDVIVYNGLATGAEFGYSWGAKEWSYDPLLRFRKTICRKPSGIPSETAHHEGGWHTIYQLPHSFFKNFVKPIAINDSTINAYNDCCVSLDGLQEEETDAYVRPPFNCAIGDVFWAIYANSGFTVVEAKLLSVLEWYEPGKLKPSGGYACEPEAKVRVQILQVKNMLASIKPLSDEMKAKLREQPYHDYITLDFNKLPSAIYRYAANFKGSLIFTDEDGIDHCVRWFESEYKPGCSFMRDTILGFRADRPPQLNIENMKHLLLGENGTFFIRGVHVR